jgi:hypothetical protein
MPIRIENFAGLSSEGFGPLAEELASQRTIKHALDWLAAHDPPLRMLDVVAQDEYCHDILATGPDGLVLAYDCT